MTFRNDHTDPGPFPFEGFIRQRYYAFRRRRTFDLASVFQLAALIVVLGLVAMALLLVISVLVAVLIVSPLVIVAQGVSRLLTGDDRRPPSGFDPFEDSMGNPPRQREPRNPTVIDIEVDRS